MCISSTDKSELDICVILPLLSKLLSLLIDAFGFAKESNIKNLAIIPETILINGYI